MGPINLRRSLCVVLTILCGGWAVGGCDKPATSGGSGTAPPPTAATLDLSTPEAAAKAFFAALERKDVATLERVMSIDLRAKGAKEGFSGATIINDWAQKKISFVSLGKPKATTRESDRQRFPYTIKRGDQLQEDSLQMVREGGEWRLDRL